MKLNGAGFVRRRAHLWQRLQPALRRTPAFQPFAGGKLSDFPVITPLQMREDYQAYNSMGFSDHGLRAMAARSEAGAPVHLSDPVAGYSTGTSGTRGVFLASEAERARYLGQSIARLLPSAAMMIGARIVLFLRANSALYSDVHGSLSHFKYFPLEGPLQDRVRKLEDFSPSILIAPSHVLAGLAERGVKLGKLRRCFYGAEPMGEAERAWIEGRLGVRPDPIYQATEGFLGAACSMSRLHLNDHDLEIELHPVAGTAGFQPIVSDMHRSSQPIVRVMLDDFVETDDQICPCGFAGRTILPPQGRVDDLWRFPGRVLTPGMVVNAMEDILGPQTHWHAQAAPTGIRLFAERSGTAPGLAEALKTKLQLAVPVHVVAEAPVSPFPKRRRVRWLPHG